MKYQIKEKIEWEKNIFYNFILMTRLILLLIFILFTYYILQSFNLIIFLVIVLIFIYLIFSFYKDYNNSLMIIGISNEKLYLKTRKKVDLIKWDEIKKISNKNSQYMIILKDNTKKNHLNLISKNLRNNIIKKYFEIRNIELDPNLIKK